MLKDTRALQAHTADVIRIDIARLRKPLALPAFLPANVPARIAALTDKTDGPNGVWRWLGSVMQSNGYPQISFVDQTTGKRTTMNVHRVLMCIEEGRRLARAEHVLHNPGVPRTSVNPKQMRIGTHQDNMADAVLTKSHRPKLKPAAVLHIVRLAHKDGCDITDIAHACKVDAVTVRHILRGKTHSKLTGIQRHSGGVGGRPSKQRAS